MKIVTNNKYREILYSYDVPDDVLKDQFDYMENPEEHSFFKYKNEYYDLGDFVIASSPEFVGWDGYSSDSYFSGLVIKLSDCGDSVLVGRF